MPKKYLDDILVGGLPTLFGIIGNVIFMLSIVMTIIDGTPRGTLARFQYEDVCILSRNIPGNINSKLKDGYVILNKTGTHVILVKDKKKNIHKKYQELIAN